MITRTEYEKALKIVKEYNRQSIFEKTIGHYDNDKELIKKSPLHEFLSIRVANALFSQNGIYISRWDSKVEDLSKLSRAELFRIRGIRHKAIIELEALCELVGISLLP